MVTVCQVSPWSSVIQTEPVVEPKARQATDVGDALVLGIGWLGWLGSPDAFERNEWLLSQSGTGFGAAWRLVGRALFVGAAAAAFAAKRPGEHAQNPNGRGDGDTNRDDILNTHDNRSYTSRDATWKVMNAPT